jgi:hypothetical protein
VSGKRTGVRRPFRTLAAATEAAQRYEKQSTVLSLALTDAVRGASLACVLVEEHEGEKLEARCSRLTSPHGGIVVIYWRSANGRDSNVIAHYLEEWARDTYDRGVRSGSAESMAWARLAARVLRARNEALHASELENKPSGGAHEDHDEETGA